MGGGYSESASASASSGNKISTGPVTFGGIAFGPQGNGGGAGGRSYLPWIIASVGILAAFFFLKK